MKIIRVKSCSKCLYFNKEVAYWSEAHCINDKSPQFNRIKSPSKIPVWCPLEGK